MHFDILCRGLSAGRRGPVFGPADRGANAGEDAASALKEVFGKDFKKIRIIRLVLLNPIDSKKINNKIHIIYSLPIRVGLSKISGPGDIEDIISIFLNVDFKIRVFPSDKAKSMELSKLFLNLIGIASATRGFSIEKGFQDPEVFKKLAASISPTGKLNVLKTSTFPMI